MLFEAILISVATENSHLIFRECVGWHGQFINAGFENCTTQLVTLSKRTLANALESRRKLDVGQLATSEEGFATDGLKQTVMRKCDSLQRYAVTESIMMNRLDSDGNSNSTQFLALFKSTFTDLSHADGQLYDSQLFAPSKGSRPNSLK